MIKEIKEGFCVLPREMLKYVRKDKIWFVRYGFGFAWLFLMLLIIFSDRVVSKGNIGFIYLALFLIHLELECYFDKRPVDWVDVKGNALVNSFFTVFSAFICLLYLNAIVFFSKCLVYLFVYVYYHYDNIPEIVIGIFSAFPSYLRIVFDKLVSWDLAPFCLMIAGVFVFVMLNKFFIKWLQRRRKK